MFNFTLILNLNNNIIISKNHVDLNSSLHLRIRRSKGNPLVDPKKIKKYKKGKVNNSEVTLHTLN